MPLVEVSQDVAQVLVPAPVRLLPALVGREVEGAASSPSVMEAANSMSFPYPRADAVISSFLLVGRACLPPALGSRLTAHPHRIVIDKR